jgi:Resolvase, N terminal domain
LCFTIAVQKQYLSDSPFQASKKPPNPLFLSFIFQRVFGHPIMPMKAVLYTRVSTHDQQTLPLQQKTRREYAKKRGWIITLQIKEVGSGAKTRPQREVILKDRAYSLKQFDHNPFWLRHDAPTLT